jgi:hypothetical protein
MDALVKARFAIWLAVTSWVIAVISSFVLVKWK